MQYKAGLRIHIRSESDVFRGLSPGFLLEVRIQIGIRVNSTRNPRKKSGRIFTGQKLGRVRIRFFSLTAGSVSGFSCTSDQLHPDSQPCSTLPFRPVLVFQHSNLLFESEMIAEPIICISYKNMHSLPTHSIQQPEK